VATNDAVTEAVAQVVHTLVLGKESADATTAPLTVTVMGRSAVVPLEYRKVSVTVPAVVAGTLSSRYDPTALVRLTKPVPVNPAWLLSTVPEEIVPFSASYGMLAAEATRGTVVAMPAALRTSPPINQARTRLLRIIHRPL
jgi:hypothetical protein